MTISGWQRFCFIAAGLGGAIAVGFAAYGAHGLDGQAADWIERGSRFQLIHAAALLGLSMKVGEGRWFRSAAVLMTAGMILFSGALYAMAVAHWPVVFLVPFGGTSFILAWLSVLVAGLQAR
jgi:uncharacterized membrane protein YgdD (TMEM256/DUF423 family)